MTIPRVSYMPIRRPLHQTTAINYMFNTSNRTFICLHFDSSKRCTNSRRGFYTSYAVHMNILYCLCLLANDEQIISLNHKAHKHPQTTAYNYNYNYCIRHPVGPQPNTGHFRVRALSHVIVLVLVVFVPFHVIAIDQRLDALF